MTSLRGLYAGCRPPRYVVTSFPFLLEPNVSGDFTLICLFECICCALSQVVNDDVLNDLLQDVCRALVESDVNIKVVATLRKGIKEKVNLADAPAGLNRRKMVQRAVMEELVRLVDSGTKPYQMKKGKSNVIMFVGLQGSGKTTTIAKYANYYQRKVILSVFGFPARGTSHSFSISGPYAPHVPCFSPRFALHVLSIGMEDVHGVCRYLSCRSLRSAEAGREGVREAEEGERE